MSPFQRSEGLEVPANAAPAPAFDVSSGCNSSYTESWASHTQVSLCLSTLDIENIVLFRTSSTP